MSFFIRDKFFGILLLWISFIAILNPVMAIARYAFMAWWIPCLIFLGVLINPPIKYRGYIEFFFFTYNGIYDCQRCYGYAEHYCTQ